VYTVYSWGIGLDYSTLAANNFTVALQGGDAAQCAAHGLGCIAPALPTTASDDNHSSMWGYNVGDEPGQYQFPQFAEQFHTIRRLRPGTFGFANLLQSYCPSGSLAANPPAPANATGVNMSLAYVDYVESFATVVQPDILCTDYYPYFERQNLFPMYNRLDAVTSGRGTPSMENYLENMMVLRDAAQRHNLTWWNYFGAAAFQGHTMVSEVQMKMQMTTSITMGARGLLYWVLGKGDPHGWAGSIGGKVAEGRHWAQAKRLNSHIVALGPTLMKLRSQTVVRIARNASLGAGLGNSPVPLVQETLGCSVMTYSDIVNAGGSNMSKNPTCMGNFHYVTCPGIRSSATQPTVHATTTPAEAPTGYCIEGFGESDCRLLCDAMQRRRVSSPTVCGSFDWSPGGRCCVNPPGVVFLMPDAQAVHRAKVSDNETWTCPHITPGPCSHHNSSPECKGYTGSIGAAIVGHDFLLGVSTHEDDGRQALTLMNFDTTITASPTVVIPSATTNLTQEPNKLQLVEIDPISGREIAAVDDIPALPGLQISLDVAEARVFLIGNASSPTPMPPPAPPPPPPPPAPQPIFPSWAVPGDLPNISAPHSGFPLLPGVIQQLVYTQDQNGTGSYVHQPIIGIIGPAAQQRLIIAIKSHGDASVVGDEEGPGQRVLFSVPSAGASPWSAPQVLFPNITTILPHQADRTSVVGIALMTCPFVRLRGRSYAYAQALSVPRENRPPVLCDVSPAPAEWNASSYYLPPLLRRVRVQGEAGCSQAVCLGPVFWLATVFPPLISSLVPSKPGHAPEQLLLGQLPSEMQADAETLFDPLQFPPLGVVPTNTSTIHGGTVPGKACPCRGCPPGSPPTMGCLSMERHLTRLASGLEVLFIRNDYVIEHFPSGVQHSLWASTRQSGAAAEWSVPASTGLPDAGSNFATGHLPDGRLFIVSNGGGILGIRNPLTIFIAATSNGTGALQFTHASVVAWGSPFGMPSSPPTELSYPSVALAEHEGAPGLWVTYSVNEADIGVSWVPVAALPAAEKFD
jgi:hypothetical protein